MDEQTLYELLGIAQKIAPTGVEQAALAKHYNAMAGEPIKERFTRLIGVIYDGLAYGNWPK